jgi:uncharacterized lipoprotein YmbA
MLMTRRGLARGFAGGLGSGLALAAAGVPVALVAGCSSPNPSLYTLSAVPGPVQAVPPLVVKLRTLGVAHYLERPQIVRSSEDYRLDVMANDWWGEPLGAMLGRILAAELTQRLPGSTVYVESGAVSSDPDATVEINIDRLDQDAAGQLVLSAQVATTGRHAATRTVRYAVAPPAAGVTGFAAAVSTAVGQLADTVAGMIAMG